MAARQLPLPLLPRAEIEIDPIPDSSNAVARTWLGDPGSWPSGRLALHGPEGSGKSAFLAQAARRLGLRRLSGPSLRGVPDGAPTALDDADCAAEEPALFHLINACAAGGHLLLMAGREPPARWKVALPDLASRLRATAAAPLGQPTDALLRALLARHFERRQLRVEPAIQDWLLARLPREAAVLAEAAARLDRAALAHGGAVTRALARLALAGLIDGSGDGLPEEIGWDDAFGDDCVVTLVSPSASMGRLL
ncbi:chromosomal replication initiator DnaA [Roseomonas xinghualingensis]|uniref:chromosomal replication initiator DnaA n=1 Tax=Roseomonas xinghualingensis TaxID=2986475 RepID=UPI0021F119D9|nr:chromosomal replication initiator DnaA [Roseomonas sp. SXEYE001]MCV4208829.1 chromosomal replication initiator DnaA [Roseomonas sp. SXEYE001]